MTRSWWPPWRRRPDTSKQPRSPGAKGRDERLDETRRIVRHIKKALRPEQEPEEEEAPPEPLRRFSVTTVSGFTHVNYHCARRLLEPTFVKKDPVTKKLKRVLRRFDQSRIFYAENGELIDDDNR